jgi:hypothetical protein
LSSLFHAIANSHAQFVPVSIICDLVSLLACSASISSLPSLF